MPDQRQSQRQRQRELRTILGQLEFLPDEAWEAALPLLSGHHYEPGTHILAAGSVIRSLFFVTSGLARFYYLDANGREFNKSFAVCGQVAASLSSLLSGYPSPFSVQALVATSCLSLRYDDFLDLTDRYPAWGQLRLRLLEQLALKKERREADFLLLSATERYEKFLAEFAAQADRIPNYHIASYLGITEVALSRIRRRLGLTRVNEPRSD